MREIKLSETNDKILEILKNSREIKLELCSGLKKGVNGWTTLDMNDISDLFWDLKTGIPFPDRSISKIYSSHFLEHLTFPEIKSLLNECLRVLKKDGVFSISVPNARLFISAYYNNDILFWEQLPLHYMPAFNNTSSLIDLVNYIAYMDGHHKYMFDEENLIKILTSSGFQQVCLRDFDPEIDSAERRHESIYAIGFSG